MPLAKARLHDRYLRGLQGEPEAVAEVVSATIPGPSAGVPVRIYRPHGAGPLPVLVFFHGGGWIMGDLDSDDWTCRALCNRAHCIVVSVDYRLAPEHPFPEGLMDCYAATQWVWRNAPAFSGDPAQIAVGGPSAGGNLAAAVALMARHQNLPPIAHQLLLVPATSFEPAFPSRTADMDGWGVTPLTTEWFWERYVRSPLDGWNPLVSPLEARTLAGLPSALVVTAEFDPVRDEGEAYGERLAADGVPARVSRYPGMIHSFLSYGAVVDAAHEAIEECAEALGEAFAASRASKVRIVRAS